MESFLSWFVVGVFGLAVGSFLNVVIYRIPRGESIVFPSSHCPNCSNELKWYHNIPLLSWLFLRGRCAYCHEPISPKYPLIEVTNALLWVVVYMKCGLGVEFLFTASSFSALLALSTIDFEYYAVPDSVNFFALGSAILIHSGSLFDGSGGEAFLDSLADAAIASGGLWAIAALIGFAARKEAMGGADVIVAGTMAAILGLSHFFLAIFLSAILAIVPSALAKDTKVPFVPFLAISTITVYLFSDKADIILSWIMHG